MICLTDRSHFYEQHHLSLERACIFWQRKAFLKHPPWRFARRARINVHHVMQIDRSRVKWGDVTHNCKVIINYQLWTTLHWPEFLCPCSGPLFCISRVTCGDCNWNFSPSNTLQYYFPFNNRKAKVDQDQVQEIKYSFFLCEEEVTDDEDRARLSILKKYFWYFGWVDQHCYQHCYIIIFNVKSGLHVCFYFINWLSYPSDFWLRMHLI